jgi:hypothetical protein
VESKDSQSDQHFFLHVNGTIEKFATSRVLDDRNDCPAGSHFPIFKQPNVPQDVWRIPTLSVFEHTLTKEASAARMAMTARISSVLTVFLFMVPLL